MRFKVTTHDVEAGSAAAQRGPLGGEGAAPLNVDFEILEVHRMLPESTSTRQCII